MLGVLALLAGFVLAVLHMAQEAGRQARTEQLGTTLSLALRTELREGLAALSTLAQSHAAQAGDDRALRGEMLRLLPRHPGWATMLLLDQDAGVTDLRGAGRPAEDVQMDRATAIRALRGPRQDVDLLPGGEAILRVPLLVDGVFRGALVAVLDPAAMQAALGPPLLPAGWGVALTAEDGRAVLRLPPGRADGLSAGQPVRVPGTPWTLSVLSPPTLLSTAQAMTGVAALLALAALIGLRRPGPAPAAPPVPAPVALVENRTARKLLDLLTPLRDRLAWLEGGASPPIGVPQVQGAALLQGFDDLLDLLRIEAEGVAIESADLDLPALLRQVAGDTPPALDPGLPRWMRGDPARLARLLRALVAEAAQAGPGPVTLSARLLSGPDRVEIRVAPRISLPGRPPLPVRRALCHRLAEAMGGHLEEAGEKPGGPVLVLPFRPGTAPGERLRGIALRVLLAEDVPAQRLLLTAVLARAGHAVTAAADGPQALAALQAGEHDMVLLDLNLPGLDGFGVAAALRAMPGARGRLPVIAVTAEHPAAIEAACREAGFDAVLQKPYETARLLGLIEALRSRSATERGGALVG